MTVGMQGVKNVSGMPYDDKKVKDAGLKIPGRRQWRREKGMRKKALKERAAMMRDEIYE